MKTTTLKKASILIIALLVLALGTFLIIYFNDYSSTKKIERLKMSDIVYLGTDDYGNFVYMGNDSKVYKFSEYTSMQEFAYETVNVRKDGLEGIISKDNKIIVPFGKYYDILDDRVCGTYVVQNEEGKYGLISYDGKVILDTIYDSIQNFGTDVPVFKAKYEDKYFIQNISGNMIYDTTNASVEVAFGEKLYKNTDRGLVKILDNGVETIYDTNSGKMVYSGKGISTAYNVVKDSENNRFVLIDNKGKEKSKVDYISGEEKLELKLDKYLVIQTKAGYYEIFDKNFNKILETERVPVFYESYKGNIYIINNVDDGVVIYKDFKQYSNISGYEYVLENTVEYGSMVPLKKIETEKVDLFNFELELLKSDVLLDKIYPKYVTLLNSDSEKIAYTISGDEIVLGKEISLHALNTNSTFNDYILISKSENVYDILDLKGNSVIKNIEKIELLLDNYIIITDNSKKDMYLFNMASNKEIFRFAIDKYDSAYENIQAIKLKTGYFNYKGKQIAKIDE